MAIGLLVVAALLAGCALVPTQGPAVPPAVDLPAVALTCGDDHVFGPQALTAVGEAHLAVDAPGDALRAFLATPEGAAFGTSSWVRTSETADRVQFIGRRPNDAGWLVVGFRVRNGNWELDLAAECKPRVVLGGGLGPADWWIDPAAPRPGPDATEFDVLVLERACAGGQSSDGRIAPPFVLYEADAVVLTFGVVLKPGGQRCPGHPPGSYHVTLDEPIGDRWLLDGGVFPPRDATTAPSP
ncbi:MAG: hypothetical protein WEF51_03650, partial [Chloroflexota bacterium]